MKTRHFLLSSLCLLATHVTVANTPTRDYTMVDLRNGLTTKLLNIGSTSLTVSVEWPFDVEIDYRWLYFIGKLDIEEEDWRPLTFLDVDPAQGEATFELLYDRLSWAHPDDMETMRPYFEKKAFFAVRIPYPSEELEQSVFRGRYEGDDEPPKTAPQKPPVETGNKGSSHEEKSIVRNYWVVNFGNGITSRLIKAGTNSVTFFVEWPLGTDIPKRLMLIGKLDMEDEWWSYLARTEIDPAKGNAIIEFLYDEISWHHMNPDATKFTPNVFFSVQRFANGMNWLNTWGTAWYGSYEEVGFGNSEISISHAEEVEIETRNEKRGEEKLETMNDELEIKEEPNETNRLWLFAGIIFCLYAVCHFLRKRSPKNQKMKP